MRIPFRHVLALTALAACLASLPGCGKSAPTRYYTLTPMQNAQGAAQADSAPAATPCYSLGIGPVEFPAYLDRTQMVTQGPGNQMHLADFDQWVEPLHENFKRILMDNLAGSLCARPLMLSPWPAGVAPRYQLAIQVQRFDGELGREAVLKANWSILNPAGEVLVWRSTTLREPVAGGDYAGLAAAQSALVATFGQELAGAVKGLKP